MRVKKKSAEGSNPGTDPMFLVLTCLGPGAGSVAFQMKQRKPTKGRAGRRGRRSGSVRKGGKAGASGSASWGSPSPVFASTETELRRFPSWIPKSRNLYFLLGSRSGTVTWRWSAATGTTWGCPSLSWYWTTKELNSPLETVHERPTESGVTCVTVSSPRCSFWGDCVAGAGGRGAGIGEDKEHG